MIALDTNVLVRSAVIAALRAILASPTFVVEVAELAVEAVSAYEDGKGDFADYLIRARALKMGASRVLTFDGYVQREPGFGTPPR